MLKSVATLAAIAALAATHIPTASATVAQPAPAVIVLSGPSAGLTVTAATDHPGARVALWGPNGKAATTVADRAGRAILKATMPSASLPLGTRRWEIEDGSAPVTGVAVTVLRATRVSAPMARVGSVSGSSTVSGIVSHYDPRTNGFAGDSLSPVWIQEVGPTGWVTRRVATTSRTGGFTVTLPLAPGAHTLRLVRPYGPTGAVTGGTGIAVTFTAR